MKSKFVHSLFQSVSSVALIASLMGGAAIAALSTPLLASADEAAPVLSSVGLIPSSGTATTGDQLQVYFREANGESDLSTAPGSVCQVNGVTVTDFENLTDGLYRAIYTVGANDANQTAGNIPVNCTLQNASGATVTASAWTDGNTVAIDTTASSTSTSTDNGGSTSTSTDNGGGTSTSTDNGGSSNTGSTGTSSTSPSFTSVGLIPSSGTATAGDNVQLYLQAANNESDLSLGSVCTVNGVNVTQFENLTDGLYRAIYTVGDNDQSQTAGNIPVNCTLETNAGATVTAHAWTDNNTLAIDTSATATTSTSTNNGGSTSTSTDNGGGTGSTSTTTGTQAPELSVVGAIPWSGNLTAGDQLQVYLREIHGMNDLTLDGACTINGVSVTNLENLTNGLYRVTYTVGANDASAAPGMIPVNCTLADAAGSTTASAWTDSNTTSVNWTSTSTDNGGGSTSTSTNNGGGSTSTSTDNGSGSLSGTVDNSNGVLTLTSITPVQTTAVADGSFNDGWVWTFNVTVPTNETSFAMKFSDWTASTSSSTIPAAGNIRISSNQALNGPVTMTAANTYSAPLTLTGDMDPSTAGRQIQVKVEVSVPAGTANGSYSTNYGIESNQ